MITNQQAYERMRAHALTMERRAADDKGNCMYRSPHGPCLIGIFLSDEVAEELDAGCGVNAGNLVKRGLIGGLDGKFADACQWAHDSMEGEHENFGAALAEKLDEIAAEYGLEVVQ